MHEQKLEKLDALIRETKQKIEKVSELNRYLEVFNFKLEALLLSISEVSLSAPEGGEESVEMFNISFSDLNVRGSDEKVSTKKEKAKQEKKEVARELGVDGLLEKVHRVIPDNKLYRINADKLVRFLFSNKEGVLHEEVLKKSGVSKYRCIDILNVLMNTEPPIVSKTFDRGFMYKLNTFLKD